MFEVTGQASENNLIVQKKVDRLRTFPHFLDFENTQLSFKPVVISESCRSYQFPPRCSATDQGPQKSQLSVECASVTWDLEDFTNHDLDIFRSSQKEMYLWM